jgi:hypothetical protein
MVSTLTNWRVRWFDAIRSGRLFLAFSSCGAKLVGMKTAALVAIFISGLSPHNGTKVYVYRHGETARHRYSDFVQLYAVLPGGKCSPVPLANPFYVDRYGNGSFCAEPGSYDYVVSVPETEKEP